ncbi:MAG TPA: LLM class flavin-dependent oxidoreductase [Ktedonobacteraceae bacterium]|nr:LLM class flavin-dependent oxidoreductase [Ktedonobacteraceae bacterium]
MVQERLAVQDIATRPLRERVGLSIKKEGFVAGYKVKEVIDEIKEAEQAGIHDIWIPQVGSIDTMTVFTAAALQTQHIRFNLGIVPIFTRHPLVLAQQVFAFNEIAPGRLRLGIGSSNQILMGMYGIRIEKPLSYLREYMSVLRTVLETGHVDYEGHFFQVHYHWLEDRIADVPLMISALGEKAFETAGEIADAALPWLAPLSYLRDKALPALKKGALSRQRPAPPIIQSVLVALSEDPQAVQRETLKQLEVYLPVPYFPRLFAAAGLPIGSDRTGIERLISELVVQGSVTAVEAQLRQMLAAEAVAELNITLVPVVDEKRELAQLQRIISNL